MKYIESITEDIYIKISDNVNGRGLPEMWVFDYFVDLFRYITNIERQLYFE